MPQFVGVAATNATIVLRNDPFNSANAQVLVNNQLQMELPWSSLADLIIDTRDGSTSSDQDTVDIQNVAQSTSVGVWLGLGSQTVNVGDANGVNDVLGYLNVSDDPNQTTANTNIKINVDDQGDGLARDVILQDSAESGFDYISGLGQKGQAALAYEHSAETTLTVLTDAAPGNTIKVLENEDPTDLIVDAVTYVDLGGSAVGAQDLKGKLSIQSDEAGTPDDGNIYITVDDRADPTVRTATVTTFDPVYEVGKHPVYDTPWGSLSGLVPATINYEYADTSMVLIEGNTADQIVNPGTTPVYLNVAPVVTAINPASGPLTEGSKTITVVGDGLEYASGVRFGNGAFNALSAPPVYSSILNKWLITATIPSSTVAGPMDVTVRTSSGAVSEPTPADQFTYIAAPNITGVSPPAGPLAGDTLVTITGTDLTGATVVDFGQNAGTIVPGSDSTGLQVQAYTPMGSPGTVNVKVTTPGGTYIDPNAYAYTAAPVVQAVNPAQSGLGGGAQVTILGSGLSGATEVEFGNTIVTQSQFASALDGIITLTSPAGAAGTVHVRVMTSGGWSAVGSGDEYTYIAAPVVTGVSPNFGPYEGGTTVTFAGSNLANATAVDFGSNNPATSFGYDADGTLWAITPAGPLGNAHVTVTTAGGTSATSSLDYFDFEYVTPVVNTVSPNSGLPGGGTMVTITGNYFLGTTQVFFGGIPATSVTVNSDMQITATSPAGTAGASVHVTVLNEGLLSDTSQSDLFTYAMVPSVTGLSPSSGPVAGGTTVIITGANLSGVTAVYFGGVAGTIVPQLGNGTQITAISSRRRRGHGPRHGDDRKWNVGRFLD